MRFSSRRSPDRGGVPSGTRLPLRLGIAGAVALSALLLGGCVQPAPVKTPQAHATVKPLFASDADALAAATKAYAAYLKMSDTIAQEGGAGPERLADLVTPKWLAHERTASAKLAQSKRHQAGSTSFDQPKLQRYSAGADGTATVVAYVCLDLSRAKLLDQNDAEVTPDGVQARFPFVVTFVGVSAALLLLDRSESWDGENFC
jgi:outer membrane murein-binding lipoprotein Lpp